jgi:predicted O-methyltransferase YrrM
LAIGKGSWVNTLNSGRVAQVLERLHRDAETADRQHVAARMAEFGAVGTTAEQVAGHFLAAERADYRSVYRRFVDSYLAVTPTYGRFLYALARACKATLIVEFGSSMGISAIYLAAALRDNGGGQLIGTELEPAKAARARANLEAAGLADLVDIRAGDALETLGRIDGGVDMLHLDGAFALYLQVLKLVEPRLKPSAVVLGENAFEPEYREHVRDPAKGYVSQSLPVDEGRGNEFSVKVS